MTKESADQRFSAGEGGNRWSARAGGACSQGGLVIASTGFFFCFFFSLVSQFSCFVFSSFLPLASRELVKDFLCANFGDGFISHVQHILKTCEGNQLLTDWTGLAFGGWTNSLWIPFATATICRGIWFLIEPPLAPNCLRVSCPFLQKIHLDFCVSRLVQLRRRNPQQFLFMTDSLQN